MKLVSFIESCFVCTVRPLLFFDSRSSFDSKQLEDSDSSLDVSSYEYASLILTGAISFSYLVTDVVGYTSIEIG